MTVININDYRKCKCDCNCDNKALFLASTCGDCYTAIDEHKHISCIECNEIRIDENGELDNRVQVGMKCGVCAYG